jgi:hypothetical protein
MLSWLPREDSWWVESFFLPFYCLCEPVYAGLPTYFRLWVRVCWNMMLIMRQNPKKLKTIASSDVLLVTLDSICRPLGTGCFPARPLWTCLRRFSPLYRLWGDLCRLNASRFGRFRRFFRILRVFYGKKICQFLKYSKLNSVSRNCYRILDFSLTREKSAKNRSEFGSRHSDLQLASCKS